MTTRRVFKYPIKVTDRQVVEMPQHAEIFTAQFQRGQLCLWALVTEGETPEQRVIRVAGTGNLVPDEPLRFIATAQMPDVPLVWHIFEAFPASQPVVRGEV